MSFSLYDLTVPVLVRGLDVLATYLDKAAAFAAENNFEPAVLVNARLAPDMLSLAGQIQRASDTSKATIVRLTGVEAPSFPDTETTLDELKTRIEKTIAFLKSVTPEQFEGGETRSVELKFRTGPVTFTGDTYLLTFAIPNFFFHVTTAHDILRHNGVKVGKRDYLGI